MPWQRNSAWDDALEASPELIISGDVETEFAYRPGHVIVPEEVWIAPSGRQADARTQLDRLNAREITESEDGVRNGRKAAAASGLGLRYLAVDDDVPAFVEEFRDVGAVFNHIVVANPQRHGGYAPPRPVAGTPAPGEAGAGDGVRIAVLDTGMPASPPVAVEPFGPDEIEPPPAAPATPENPLAVGHGSMVAGVIRRHAPGATIIVRKVLDTPLGIGDELDVAMALADLPAVDIVNASFGGRAAASEVMVTFRAAVDALPAGTVVVSSAGNEGERRPHYMAAFDRVLAVAAAKQTSDGWEVEHFSNRGRWIDVCAVGDDVETVNQDGDAVACTGTSFAAPFVAARIATQAASDGVPVIDTAVALTGDAGQPLVPDAGRLIV